MERGELTRLLDLAEPLRERLARDWRRIDALAQAVRDEAWHARVPKTAPDGEAERRDAREAREIEKTLEEEIGRLRTHLGRGTERTGT